MRGWEFRHEIFCQEYVNNGGNGTKAAIAAGYSPDTARVQASKLLTYPNIVARKKELQSEALVAKRITRDRIIAGYLPLAFPEPAVVGLFPRRQPEVSNADRKGALDSLARIGGLFTDKHEIGGLGGGPVETQYIVQFVDNVSPKSTL